MVRASLRFFDLAGKLEEALLDLAGIQVLPRNSSRGALPAPLDQPQGSTPPGPSATQPSNPTTAPNTRPQQGYSNGGEDLAKVMQSMQAMQLHSMQAMEAMLKR